MPKGKVAVSVAVDAEHSVGGATGVGSYVDVYVQKDGVTDRLCGAHVIDTSENSGATREGKIEWVTLAADPEDVKELLGASGKGTVSLTIPATARGKKERRRRVMKAIWLACCACGDYGLLQQEVEGRDAGAQVLRVGDLDGLVSMARAFRRARGWPSSRRLCLISKMCARLLRA